MLRASGGWQAPEALERLDAWEEGARRRLARLEAGESLGDVYEEEDEGSPTDE